MATITEKFHALIGEFAWHSLTTDTTIISESRRHYLQISAAIDKFSRKPLRRILEVGAYSHITGYMLQQKYQASVTLFDLSVSTLKLGRQVALSQHLDENVHLFAGDFHELPFADDFFDVVYIYSALHHTLEFNKVARELQRVLSSGGLLMVMNEPYQRGACFYGFRTNRPGAFTAFEQSLQKQGIIRLIAEPHLGSRDETLFGMVENQRIPLQEMTDVFTESCDIIETSTDYETQIGEVEQSWLEWVANYPGDSVSLAEKISDDLHARISESSNYYDETAKGLGFVLPSREEIEDFGGYVAKRLQELMLLPVGSPQFSQSRSELFGGSASFICHKTKPWTHSKSVAGTTINDTIFPEIDGVRLSFPDEINQLLSPTRSIIPFIAKEHIEKLYEYFPDSCWQINLQENGFYSIALTATSGEVRFPPLSSPCLLLLRINFVCSGLPTPVVLQINGCMDYSYSHSAYQEEAILVRTVLEKNSGRGRLNITATTQNQEAPAKPVIHIYYAGLLPITEQNDCPRVSAYL